MIPDIHIVSIGPLKTSEMASREKLFVWLIMVIKWRTTHHLEFKLGNPLSSLKHVSVITNGEITININATLQYMSFPMAREDFNALLLQVFTEVKVSWSAYKS